MTFEERKKLYAALSAPFPEEAIERTKGCETGKPYDTTGIRAQFLINRLNECLGAGGYRVHRTMTVREVTNPKGRKVWEAICDMTLEIGYWEGDQFVVIGESIADGGHCAFTEWDARKAATTNAIKRACASLGVGKQAWEGTLPDDDSYPAIGVPEETVAPPPARQPSAPQPARPVSPPQPEPPHTATSAAAPVHQSASAQKAAPTQQAAPQTPTRNRITQRQLSAIWGISRKLGLDQHGTRAMVKSRYNAQPEFLSRSQASELIGELSRQAGNGHAQEFEQAASAVG